MNTHGTFIAKILVPRRRLNTITRARLLDVVLRTNNETLTIVRAPAGFGKTTVLVDVVNEASAAVCWISVDEWDQDPATFLRYLWLAVRRLGPVGEHANARAPGDEPRTMLSHIAARIAEHDHDVWVVLDDFHHLDSSDALIELVDYFARRMPPNCRLLLASRTRPPLPSLPRLQLSGNVTEIGPSDLAFTAEEIREFYSASGKQAVSDAEVSRIAALTEGWPAGVALVGDPASLSEARLERPVALAEYLASEVFDRLPEDLQSFLVRTSIFDRLEAVGCDEVLQESGTERHLQSLERHNVPVFRVEGAVVEYRVHPLFRDFLRARLADAPAQWRELNRRAGAWQASRGRTNDAIWLFAQGEDWDRLESLIESEAPLAYKRGRWHLVTSWLELVPTLELRRRPRLRLWETRILVRLGQSGRALAALAEAIDGAAYSDSTLLAELETLRASALRMKGDVRAALESCRRAVDMATRANAPIDVVTEARKQLGQALFASGSFADAAGELRAVLGVYELRGDLEEAAFVNGSLGSVLGLMGNLEESVAHLEQARQQWKKLGNAKEMSWTLNNLAMTYLRMGRRELAYELLLESLAKARQGGHDRIEAYALVSLADIERRSGDFSHAVKRYDEALTLAHDLGEMTLATHATTGLALAHLAQGDIERAEAMARRGLISAEERGSAHEQGLAYCVLGRILRRQGSLDDAIEALQSAVSLFERSEALNELTEALLHLADAVLPLRRRRTLLVATLERVALIAGEHSVDHGLANAAGEIPAVFEYAASRRSGGDIFREILRRRSVTEEGERVQAPAVGHSTSFPLVDVKALGDFQVRVGGRLVLSVEWESEKSKELFLLLLTSARPLTRDEIVAAIWPDAGGKRASSVFHSTLHRIRRALYRECLVESGGAYALQPSGTFVLDVQDFTHLTERARALADDREGGIEVLRQAVHLYSGPFAPLLDSDWAQSHRLRLEERFTEAATRLNRQLLWQADYTAALEVSERLLESDPYRETAVHQLMQALSALGDRDSAIRAYRRYSDLVELELGIKPGHEIQQLYGQILRKGKELPLEPL